MVDSNQDFLREDRVLNQSTEGTLAFPIEIDDLLFHSTVYAKRTLIPISELNFRGHQ